MVADRVTVVSRMAGPPEQGVRWESDGQGEFTVEPATKDKRGTDVILHLQARGQGIPASRTGCGCSSRSTPTSSSTRSSWTSRRRTSRRTRPSPKRRSTPARPSGCETRVEIKEDEYIEFYKHLTHDSDKPLKTIHYAAEGNIEFKALLYIPGHQPFDLLWGDSDKGLHLYIQRVFIMDDCEALLPRYCASSRGVVDSPDLPLNVSREILQQSARWRRSNRTWS